MRTPLVSEEEMSAYKSAMTLKNGDEIKRRLRWEFISVINYELMLQSRI